MFKYFHKLRDELLNGSCEDAQVVNDDMDNHFVCSQCGPVSQAIIDTIYIICPNCGECEMKYMYISSSYVGFKEAIRNRNRMTSAYKRTAYFESLLSRIQAHHCLIISHETMNTIKDKMMMNGEKYSNIRLKSILKEMKLTKFYKYSYALLSLLSKDYQKASLSYNECEQLKYLFRCIQMPYDKYKVVNRCNFMSYPFVLQKLFYQINRPDLCCMVSLPKNLELIYQNEIIWANIADELGWTNEELFF